ncbi:MAG: transporter substrate-binding domain-containing protein [Acetobacteraceae bacterium]
MRKTARRWRNGGCVAALLCLLGAAPAAEVAPSGTLRVAIAISPAPSAFWAVRDPASGQPRGVAVDLGRALAKRLGVPVQLVVYDNSGKITQAGESGGWDVAFLPVDAERRQALAVGPNYSVSDSTFLVPAGSSIQTLAEVDRPGVRVFGIGGTTTARAAAGWLKHTTVTERPSVEALVALVKAGQADAIALDRESLAGLMPDLPGARILAGHFHVLEDAVAVPKDHPLALAAVTAFMTAAKADGTVRKALDDAGLRDAQVAPP